MEDNPFSHYRSNDPVAADPRYQRRVLIVRRPIPFIENMHEVGLECKHEPLLVGDKTPRVGDMIFCPNCYENAKER